ncbi:hypothetical protein C8R42DRAFT_721043 [Lentinula raphanica]|nr:hypothetical protein C8R42DRAFT_721043 [Lentinula raphanica]
MHAVFAGQQYLVYKLKHKYNEKNKKKDSLRRVSTSARILTLEQGRIKIEADSLQRADKKRADEERQKQQSDSLPHADIVQQAEQEQLNSEFSGNMKTMSKSRLVNIAFALKVPYDDTTAEVLRIHLNADFDANKELKRHPRSIRLFEHTQKCKDPPKENDTVLPRQPSPPISPPRFIPRQPLQPSTPYQWQFMQHVDASHHHLIDPSMPGPLTSV